MKKLINQSTERHSYHPYIGLVIFTIGLTAMMVGATVYENLAIMGVGGALMLIGLAAIED